MSTVKGLWVFSTHLSSIDPWALKNAGYTDAFIFVPEDGDYIPILNQFIAKFSGTNIRIHAWITCFYHNGFIDPADISRQNNVRGTINNVIVGCSGIAGIHLDYVRYSGSANLNRAAYQQTPHGKVTITNFVSSVYDLVKGINVNLYLSAAVMPECASNADIYGQDYALLSPYLDLMVPMIYKGNYNQNTAWISSTTKWIVEHSSTKVVAGLQSYTSDSNPVPLSSSELVNDIKAAMSNGSQGFILFRNGLIDGNFRPNNILGTFTNDQVIDAAIWVKNYVEINHQLPGSVTINGSSVNIYAFYYLLSTVVQNVYNNNNQATVITIFSGPQIQKEDIHAGTMQLNELIHIADVVKVYMDKTGITPGYAYQTTLGTYMRWQTLLYTYCNMLNTYNNNPPLPTTNPVKPWKIITDPNAHSFTNQQVTDAAIVLKTNIETNHNLPNTVTVNGINVNIYTFYYLLSTVVQNLNTNNNNPIDTISFNEPQIQKEDIHAGTMQLNELIHIADVVKVYMDKTGITPGYAYQTTLGTYMRWQTLLYTYCNMLNTYNNNPPLPTTNPVKPWSQTIN